jgi:hypothetical protein
MGLAGAERAVPHACAEAGAIEFAAVPYDLKGIWF